MLPQASVNVSLGFTDSLFTSTSAVCVTGLTVVDTGSAFTAFGQTVLLVLIQTGGLGIMTIATLFILIAGKRLSFTNCNAIEDTFTHTSNRSISSIIKSVALFTLVFESLGAVLIFLCFLPDHETQKALYLSVFHSISAFCNSGFCLFSDSFAGYQTNWKLNLIICFLVIAGGIGFPVLSEIKYRLSRKRRIWARLSLHSKLVLSTTALLLLVSTMMILFMEWNNTLNHLKPLNRLISAFFQAVNARTSGFNTLPIGNMANETLFVLILFMFIGASPGSCGGGIKTTTFAILAVLGISRFRGYERPQLFGRLLTEKSIGKTVRVVLISAIVVCIGLMLLLMTELGGIPHPQARGKFLELFFEVISAFGTVGLSTGITGSLSVPGKIIITFIMFVGRLGPLLIAMAVSQSVTSYYSYAEEDVMIG